MYSRGNYLPHTNHITVDYLHLSWCRMKMLLVLWFLGDLYFYKALSNQCSWCTLNCIRCRCQNQWGPGPHSCFDIQNTLLKLWYIYILKFSWIKVFDIFCFYSTAHYAGYFTPFICVFSYSCPLDSLFALHVTLYVHECRESCT